MSLKKRSICFNDSWQFHLGEVAAASRSDFDSGRWRKLRLPHDWSIELSYTQENTGGAGAFLPGGIGWYRKRFRMPESSKEQVTWIEFDGVYNNSEVWINGHYLGMYPYGYTPFKYDLTEHLKFGGEENVIAVRVDRSAYIDCRWYPGSGIYRDVKLVSVPKIHIPQWGTFITTPLANSAEAKVDVQTTIVNKGQQESEIELSTEIDGRVIRTQLSKDLRLPPVRRHIHSMIQVRTGADVFKALALLRQGIALAAQTALLLLF